VAEAQLARARGLSLREVVAHLDAEGMTSRRGTSFSLSAVSKMVKGAA